MSTTLETEPQPDAAPPLNGRSLMGFAKRADGTYVVCVLWHPEYEEYCVSHVRTLDDPEWADGVYLRGDLNAAYRVMIQFAA
jgi:hypothetical protein